MAQGDDFVSRFMGRHRTLGPMVWFVGWATLLGGGGYLTLRWLGRKTAVQLKVGDRFTADLYSGRTPLEAGGRPGPLGICFKVVSVFSSSIDPPDPVRGPLVLHANIDDVRSTDNGKGPISFHWNDVVRTCNPASSAAQLPR